MLWACAPGKFKGIETFCVLEALKITGSPELGIPPVPLQFVQFDPVYQLPEAGAVQVHVEDE